jgi:hypothetical protein
MRAGDGPGGGGASSDADAAVTASGGSAGPGSSIDSEMLARPMAALSSSVKALPGRLAPSSAACGASPACGERRELP